MRSHVYTYGAAIAIVLIGVLWFGSTHSYFAKAPAVPLTAPVTEREAFWQERIEKEGPNAAYAEFADSIAALGPNKQHENAHTFGAALYTETGTSGLATCDSRFSYGCYHEFLGRAIASLGLQVVPELNQKCVDALGGNALSCQHGIGHGVLAAIGYNDTSLLEALAVCKGLPYSDPIGGCYGGLFMEYNMQTMLGENGRTREVVRDNLHAPCDTLSREFLPACVFWAPQWWLRLQHDERGADFADFKAVGALCDGVGVSSLVRSCYEGVGNMVPAETNFDPIKSARACEESSRDTREQLYCKSYAANSISLGGAGGTGDGRAVCTGLPQAELVYCHAYADNKANLVQQLPEVESRI